MTNINNFFDRFFNLFPGYYFGLLTFSTAFSTIGVTLFLSPNYNMWVESVSVLLQSEGGIFLRIGLIISMIFAIPFIIYLGRIVKANRLNNNLRTSTVSTGIFSSINILLLATFSGGAPFISTLHNIFSLLSWLGLLVFFILHTILLVKSLNVSIFQIILGFTLTVICVFYLFLLLVANFCYLSTGTCTQVLYIIVPAMEWITSFSICVWFLGMSINSLYKEKSKF